MRGLVFRTFIILHIRVLWRGVFLEELLYKGIVKEMARSESKWPLPYFTREIISANWGCGWGTTSTTKDAKAKTKIGLSIQWGLEPAPLHPGFLLQHVRIKQNYEDEDNGCNAEDEDWYEGWLDYIEAWKVEVDGMGKYTLTLRGDDHFCVERTHLDGTLVEDGEKLGDCRVYNAEAWFVYEKDFSEKKTDSVATSGSLWSTSNEDEVQKLLAQRRNIPFLKRTVCIQRGSVVSQASIHRPLKAPRNLRRCKKCKVFVRKGEDAP